MQVRVQGDNEAEDVKEKNPHSFPSLSEVLEVEEQLFHDEVVHVVEEGTAQGRDVYLDKCRHRGVGHFALADSDDAEIKFVSKDDSTNR